MTKNILIIDDEELIIRSLKMLLEKSGYIVYIAKNGQDATELVDGEDFDLIIADIRMPGMNGVETIQSINKNLQQRKTEKIPTIFITGYVDEEVEQQAKALEPVAYIFKPFDIEKMISVVEEVLSQ